MNSMAFPDKTLYQRLTHLIGWPVENYLSPAISLMASDNDSSTVIVNFLSLIYDKWEQARILI